MEHRNISQMNMIFPMQSTIQTIQRGSLSRIIIDKQKIFSIQFSFKIDGKCSEMMKIQIIK